MVFGFIEREPDRPAPPVRRGVLVLVVGPSGAGKDTLIRAARAQFGPADDVLFVRRAITRPEDLDGEDHQPMTPAEFDAAERAGLFAVHWHAHGLRYAIPATVDAHVGSGRVAVANGSRAALPLFVARYLNLVVVRVTARPDVLAARLAARRRESEPAILERLRRAGDAGLADLPAGAVTIDNSGEPDAAAALLLVEIRRAIAFTAVSGVT